MGHDPQRLAAAYLGGELGRRQGERFQAHLLECEACWGEVQAARWGRALAESVREVTPHDLRDRIRATIEVDPAGRRRWAVGWAGLAAAIGVAAVVVGGLLVAGRQPTQPATIAAAAASYREGGATWRGPADPPPIRQVGDLRTVDYEAISMLNVSATQELARKIAALEAENAKLKANNAELSTVAADVKSLKEAVATMQRDKGSGAVSTVALTR